MEPSTDTSARTASASQAATAAVTSALAHDQRRARVPYAATKLRRSRSDRLVGGVCGGIARFVGVGSGAVRLVYGASVLLSIGTTGLLYLLLWLLIPTES